MRQPAISLDPPIKRDDGDGGQSPLDTLATSEPGHERALGRSALRQATRRLSDRDRLILRLRFIQDLTHKQIAECIGVSQMQVSRLLRRSLQRLRETITAEPPAPSSRLRP